MIKIDDFEIYNNDQNSIMVPYTVVRKDGYIYKIEREPIDIKILEETIIKPGRVNSFYGLFIIIDGFYGNDHLYAELIWNTKYSQIINFYNFEGIRTCMNSISLTGYYFRSAKLTKLAKDFCDRICGDPVNKPIGKFESIEHGMADFSETLLDNRVKVLISVEGK